MYGGVIQTFADLKNIAGKVQGFTPATRLLAILFMRSGQEITDKLITPSLNYFHVRYAGLDFPRSRTRYGSCFRGKVGIQPGDGAIQYRAPDSKYV